MIVHQIYYDFNNKNEPMPKLFFELQKKVVKWCKKNMYSYKFWNKSMLDKLLNKYPKYKNQINNVRYEIMKVDMIKFLILYNEGGLYLDLDIEPKIKKLKDVDFAVSLSPKMKMYNVDVVQSKKGNMINLHYLDFVKKQIEEKSKLKIYDVWKVRYVLQTTGPRSFTRFLNTNKIKPITYRTNDAHNNPPRLNLIGNEDFLDYPSGAWLGKK
tara:strand:+ start:728 stop:1363 length:636 start_codon:yes stop_codon:yes gene_type:complete